MANFTYQPNQYYKRTPASNQSQPIFYNPSQYSSNTNGAKNNIGIQNIWDVVDMFYATMESNGKLAATRKAQDIGWFKQQIEENVINMIYNTQDIKEFYCKTRVSIESNTLSPRHAVETVSQYIAQKLTSEVPK